ncbi:Nonribosomal peptide synthase Pes1 [Penicillium digitatum]|uniref:Nonribosomal peptide synthase Pes1 n=2 Tax=Penicillium digitatum TaxID=36651 RepID=K9GJJ3_PEND1|nr:Nonribosomal peptide synthase Pes1 [Penicillium digitatum Pd1]EKV21467.1 Nonribosomal peptide synthase Pes1 [Penicillium digitatum Pd1]QQK46701.1 Nonribosomal peptide synthase Pes1 [Penicillium digitatum]
MPQSTKCYLPRFASTVDGPKCPVSMKTRPTAAQHAQLLTAWNEDRLDSILRATWALLLHYYIRSEDICFGYQHLQGDSRSPKSSEHRSTGVNISTIRISINDNDSLTEVVEKVRANSANPQVNGSSEAVSEAYHPFNTIFMLRTYDQPASASKPILATTLPDECQVRLHVKVLRGDISIFLEWRKGDMSGEQMKSVATIFEQLLTKILSAENIAISKLNLFSENDWQRIHKWNSTSPQLYDRCIHEAIHDQMLSGPDREAVCAWDGSLTFAELDRQASKLACHLRMLGVGPEVRVALCFEKSKWNIVAMLGVMKAGGAFVPLDPTHPTSRLQALIQSVQAPVVLCSQHLSNKLAPIAENIIPVCADQLDPLSDPAENLILASGVTSQNAAYVLFTSGSTGEPKGTLLEHRAFLSGAMVHGPGLHIYRESRCLQFAAHTFDASLAESLTPLIHGACVCIPSEEARLNDIVTTINEMRVSQACFTPSFIGFIEIESLPGLESLVLAGEAMSQSQLATWSKIKLVNGYGPTEASVASVLNSNVTPDTDCKDIGLPIGVRSWLVNPDNHDELVPVGCPGELLLEGPPLARCYVNNPQKTNESFIFDPAWTMFDAESGSNRRFYKTGDLVRYNSDTGALNYIGRKDTQVKVHGQRIELGEIENQLSRDLNVNHCSVLFPKAGFSKGRLAAVISSTGLLAEQPDSELEPLRLVSASKKAGLVPKIRERLSARLPTYMVPPVWLCVEALPLLPSGKLDRKGISTWVAGMENDPDLQNNAFIGVVGTEASQPANDREEALAAVYSRVLNIPQNLLDLNEGFLALGGDSIAAMTCIGLCKKRGFSLSVQELLRSKSIRDLATRAKTIDHLMTYEEAVDEPFRLSPIQTLHFGVRKEGQGHFNQGILTRLNKPVDERSLRKAVETLVSRHSMLRARFTDTGFATASSQHITRDIKGSYRWRMHKLDSMEEVKIHVADSQSSINCFSGPLLAVDYLLVKGQPNVLSMTAHHLVVDIVSWRIILEDLEDIILNPQKTEASDSSLPFQTWCRLQNEHCNTLRAEHKIATDTLPAAEFSYWGLQNTQTTYGNVDCASFEIDPAHTNAILLECHKALATEPIDLFLAAMLHSFGHAFPDRSLPTIYNEGHGREVWDSSIDISHTVGWFTILHPVFVSAYKPDNPIDTLMQVKDLRRRVADNGRADFSSRVLPGQDHQEPQHPHPFEMSFNYVGQHRDLQRQDGLFQLVDQMAGEAGQGGGAADFGTDTPRFGLFEISAMVVAGKVRFNFSFNKFMQHQSRIHQWVSGCQELLVTLAEQLPTLAPRLTLSSFPLLSLSYPTLDKLLNEKLPAIGIASVDIVEDIYPCSRMQQGILLGRKRDSSYYAVHDTFEIKATGSSKPNLDRLVNAWEQVVSHHAMFRTIFVENLTPRHPFCQVVLKSYDATPVILHSSGESDVIATFDMEDPKNYSDFSPAHRFTICQTPTGRLFARIEMSHAAMDGNSISIILRDLQLAYASRLEERQKPLFKDYMEYLQDTPKEASIKYWCSYLNQAKPCHFPALTDGHQTVKVLRSIPVNFGALNELQTVCDKRGITLANVFNAAWGLTLRAFCGCDDVSFSYMASLRDVPAEGVQWVIGPVINLLVCRMKVADDAKLSDVLHKVQNDYLESLPYRHTSLIDIQHALKLSDTNLFNSGVSYRRLSSSKDATSSDIECVEVGSIHDPAEFPVFINIEAMDTYARIDLNYWTTNLSDSQAANVANTYLRCLENMVSNIDGEIRQLDNLSEENRAQIMAWNCKTPKPFEKCAHHVVQEIAKKRPDALAVTAWDGNLTYSKLDQFSSRLASYLVTFGVGPNAIIPVCFEKSVWNIVSTLAVMKAGGACIPVDTPESLALVEKWIMENAVQVALASPEKARALEDAVPYVIPVSESLLEYLGDEILNPVAQPSDIAYVAMTAGTSGAAKSVVLDHSTVMTRAEAFATTMAIADVSRTLQFAPHTSDAYVVELFATFMWGGCICVPADIDPISLAASMNAFHVNVASITPTAASYFFPKDVPGLRSIALGGEVVSQNVLDHWQTDDLQLQVLYGTSESSAASFLVFCSQDENEAALIGKSTSCVSWVVDPSNHNRLVPIGSVGELVLEGPVLARGYLDNQSGESDAFINNPSWLSVQREGAKHRMFKTGDLVRYKSNGSLVFVGRKNDRHACALASNLTQTQARIDSFLDHKKKCVVESVQLQRENVNIEALVAFVVSSNTSPVTFGDCVLQSTTPQLTDTISSLHINLSTSLPGSKVPSFYIPVSSLPLTFSGKLNRQALRTETRALSSSALEAFEIKRWNGTKTGKHLSRHASLSEANVAFWKEYLADVEPCVFPALSHEASDNCRSTRTLNKQTASIHAFSRLSGLPAEILFQFAWALVLRWYVGSDDVCFGYSTSPSETKVEAEGVATCRFLVQNDRKVQDTLENAKKDSEKIALNIAALDAVKDQLGLDNTALFNTSMIYRTASNPSKGINREPSSSSSYKILVEAEVSHSHAQIHFNYSSETLSSFLVNHVMDMFDQVLDDLIAHNLNDRTIGDINVFTERSARQICDWNAASPPRLEKCADELIQQQALLHPRAEAICSWDKNFTYGQLEIVSSRLARHLSYLGIKPEAFVVLCFEKSAWAVVAQLAVLKAGGAFVSIDPSHPDSRLKMLIDEIDTNLVLCSSSIHAKISTLCAKSFAVCQISISQLSDSPLALPGVRPTPENAAYAIFTSGTTGKPKATVVEHTGLVTTAIALIDALHLNSTTRALQFSNYTFDVSVMEILMILITGGCICIPSEEERMNNLGGAIRRMEATSISAPPAIVNTLEPKNVPSLKVIITGGEKMPANHIDRWADRCVINAYGPSEATVVATVGVKVDRDGNRINNDPTSIGTSPNCRVWIVDPNNYDRLLPVGAVGELILEGSNIARGYLGNEEKTKAAFFEKPAWNRHPGLQGVFKRNDRLYRTGDLVRYSNDGSLAFISRKDTQIKFNGQRIELEEIEQQCLSCLPEDSQVAVDVVVPEERTIAKGLAAFFTIHDPDSNGGSSDQFAPTIPGADPLLLPISVSNMDAIQKLKGCLPDLLPQSMMPRLFFPIRNLPFTSSGKIDRRRLRAMVQTLSKDTLKSYITFNISDKRNVSSATALETKLVALVEKTLELEVGSVTTDDSFFGLGGDSLSAMNLVGAAQAEGIALTVSSIFNSPILIDMAKSCVVSEAIELKKETTLAFSLLPSGVNLEDLIDEITDNCEVSKDLISDIYPCSAVQEGLLTLSIKHHGAYVAQPTFRLAPGIDIGRFKQAWQQTVADLEILRTRIVHTEAMNFAQVILKNGPISWVEAESFDALPNDILHLPKQNGAPLTGYAMVQPPDSSDSYFVWSVHHALYDGWSIPLVFRKVEENYFASQTKRACMPYSLFINYLAKKNMEESDSFWKSYLTDLSSTAFPLNKNAVPDAMRAGNTQHHSMRVFRSRDSVDFTIPVLMRAAWAIVIATHTASGDVCFGETLSGRNIDLPGVADIAGPVLTTVPTRVQVDNAMSTMEYLQKIHQSTTEMIPHLHSGLQRIRQLNKNTATGCDFKNLLVIQPGDGELDNKIWIDEKRETSEDFFTHPLVVECGVTKTNISFTVHHDELVINGWQTKRITAQFAHVLQQLIAMPKNSMSKLGDLEVISPEDKAEIGTWNQRTPLTVERTVHDIIREKCDETPNAQAVCAWDGDLTFKEFWDLASGFANYLVSRGVGPEVFVPVCLDKSAWAMVTLISVLIAGGGYVPLDPSHPTSRHEEILADVGATMILCTPNYANRYSRVVKTVVPISKETIKAYGALKSSARRQTQIKPSNMAYALFTSGSTGRAKGIIVEHRNVVSSIMAFAPWVRMDETSRVFQFASLTFDAAVMETIAILMLGGTICVPSEDDRLNDVAGAIRRLNVTWTFLTPSIASIIEPSSVPSLKHLVCGGEKMSNEVITKWANSVHLMNGYGPTETCVFAVVDNAVATNRDPGRIGYGIPSTLTWIVDPDNHDRLTPLGAVGELALEGAPLAREYLKNPEKNAEAFTTDPAWIKDFAPTVLGPRRIYKTGDLCYYNPDGSVQYISRKDHQVKLHGQRMELGEIEHRLSEDALTRHAVVVLPKNGPLKQRLVTVLSLNSVAADTKLISDKPCELVDEDELERHAYNELVEVQTNLENQLPIYMVPQTWALIKKLPMLVSGKLDRKKITAWVEDIDDVSYDRIMADYDRIKRGKTQEKRQEKQEKNGSLDTVRDIFAQVLNISLQKVNVDRSFVSLGGDSITGMAVISRARKQGLVLTLHDILQSRSVKELAQTVSSKVPVARREEKSGEGFTLSPVQLLYFQSSDSFKGTARFNQSITVRIVRRCEGEVLKRALKAVVSQHAMFRARFSKSSDGTWQQKTAAEVDESFRFRVHSVGDNRAMVPKIADSQTCLDPLNGPILAADLFNLRTGGQVLFLVAHHLCIDMVSWRIVLQDLEELVVSGSLSLEKPLSFQSWCAMQTERAKTHDSTISLPFTIEKPNLLYWGMQESLNVYGDIKMESFSLSEDTTQFILDGCHNVFRTDTVDILLSAIIHSFGRTFTDRKVPTIYNEGHGREPWEAEIDLSRTVGWFTTMAPLLVDSEARALNEIIKRVKDIRRKTADNGRPYFAKSLLHDQAADFPVPLEILFNYLGKMQQLERDDSLFHHHGSVFDSSDFAVAGDMGPKTARFALFEVSAIVIKDRLNVAFTYNSQMQHGGSIRRWIAQCKQTLEKDLLTLKTATPEPTLSDYPLLPINYHGLQMLTASTFRKAGIRNKDDVEDIYPCSPMQEGLLLSQLRDPNAYMFHTVFEIKDTKSGKVDAEGVARAWQVLVDRHPVLRTIFVDSNYTGGSFDQLVLNKISDNILRVECENAQVEEKLAAISLRDRNAMRQSKLSHQLTVCKTNTGRVVLKLEINHAIIDGGSVDVILRDLTLAYERKISEGSGPLFSDYIKFIRTQSQSDALIHWKRYLDGVHPCHLAQSAVFEAKRELKGVMMNFQRFPELLKFCECSSVTLANLTLSAWAIVLRQFTGSDDVCFGYLSAGRDAPVNGIQDMVGIFINMLCCRVQFSDQQTLTDVSKNVQDDYIRCIPHQSCSLASIQHELGWQGQSLFNTTLSIQNHSVAGGAKEKGLSFDLQHAHDPSEYAVTVNVEIARGQEGILLRYWNDVVSDEQAQSLAETIAKVFSGFIESPAATLSQSTFSAAAEPELLDWDRSQTTLADKAKSTGDAIDSCAIQKIIDDRVHEIIGQMLREGKLTVPPISTEGLSSYGGHTDTVPDSPYQLGVQEADDSGVCSATSCSSEDGMSADMERKLWNLWSTALGLSPNVVRHQESFFKLGGDSITAMKMVSAAREEGLVLTVADVFNNPVFEDMLTTVRAANVTQQILNVDLKSGAHKEVDSDLLNITPTELGPSPSTESLEYLRPSCVDDAAVQSGICPKIGVFKGGIADVLPVTDFQAMSLTATLFKSRWMLNYFYLEGNGSLDLRRLRESCLKVVAAFDILRTVFVCFHDQFFQVVLRKIRPSIFVYETDRALDEFTMTLQQRDREYGSREGEQYVQFYVVKKKGSDQHRILIRLSHTQYDGVCLPKIMSAIKHGYEGTPLPPATPFAGYLRQLPGTITPDHYRHWTDLLKGSQMTQVVRRKGTSMFQNVGAFTEIHRKIEISPTALGNVTIATVMQAAWALALAKLSAQSDVVFGLTISGRNATVPGIESTVGPCVNVIPVRVKLDEKWTGVDLFRYLQDQQVSNMPFESLGFREIIKQCTDWPDWTYFTTSVFHQNVDYEGTMELDNNKYRMGGVGVNDNLADLTMVSRPSGERGLDVTLGYSEKGPVMPFFASKVLDMACEIAQSLVANPTASLPSASMLRSLPLQTIDDLSRPSDEHFLSAHLKSRSIAELLVHSDILSHSWHRVLPSRTAIASVDPDTDEKPATQPNFQLDSSFFDLGGDVFHLAQLTWLLEQEGLKVRLEDLIEHPSFLGQMAVLALHNAKHQDEIPNESLATGAASPDPVARIEKKKTWSKAMTIARKLTGRNTITARA